MTKTCANCNNRQYKQVSEKGANSIKMLCRLGREYGKLCSDWIA